MATQQSKPCVLDGRRTRRRLATSSPSLNSGVVHNKSGGHCKIRKRVSQSSSSSSVVKNYKFKRAIFVGKSGGSTTPVPTWKLIMADSQSPLYNSIKNGVKYVEYAESNHSNNHHQHNTTTYTSTNNKAKEAMSARKLAATLWEIDGLHSPAGLKDDDIVVEPTRGRKSSQRVAKLLQRDPHTPVYDQIDGSKVGGHRRISSATFNKLEISEYVAGVQETVGNANSFQMPSPMAEPGETNFGMKTRLKDVNNSLVASKELVKVLFRILSQEEQNSSTITLVSALRAELDRARLQVDMLIQEQRSNCNQMDALLKQFAEEKAAWKSRERERIRETISSLAREVGTERKLRRQCERLNKKLGKELADTRAHFSKVMKKLDKEKRAREILEQTCDELARGIGEERVEVEEMKKESEKAREEVEKERQMLQLADVLREERVQMKLAEARYEYEEKNAALEKLKSNIETYLKTKDVGDEHDDGASKIQKKSSGLQEFLSQIQASHFLLDQNVGDVDAGEDPKRDSGDSSELHSIELNMENNKSYKWNFACEGNNQTQAESRRASVEEMFKGRRSLSEKIQWENICLQRKTSDGSIEWDFTAFGNKPVKNVNGLSSQVSPDCEEEGHETDDSDFNRYKPVIKSQKLPFRQGSASPAISTGNSSRLREACSAILKDLATRREQLEGNNGWVNKT